MRSNLSNLKAVKEPCIICGGQTRVFHIGHAAIGGHKCKSREESLAVFQVPLDLQWCSVCNMARYTLYEQANKILQQMYESQESTYGLLLNADNYLSDFAERVCETYPKRNGIVLEIGCNDGALLNVFRNKFGRRILGIEPGKGFSEIWRKRGVRVINDFFSSDLILQLKDKTFDIIIIRHVLEHMIDPVLFLNSVFEIASQHTAIIVESPYFPTVLFRGRFENISYAHLNHFSIRSVDSIIKKFGWGVSDVRLVNTDGGSFVAHINKGTNTSYELLDKMGTYLIDDFLERMKLSAEKTRMKLLSYDPKNVVGYGAGAKGPHLLSLYGLESLVDKVIDDNPSFHGLYLAGTELEIVSPQILQREDVHVVINLAPTHATSVRKKVPEGIEVVDII